MPFDWPRLPTDQPEMVGLVADRRLCLTADQERVVESGDMAAAWLLAAPGTLIPKPDVERLGLVVVEGRVVQRSLVPAAPVVAPVAAEPVVEAPKVEGKRGRKKPEA